MLFKFCSKECEFIRHHLLRPAFQEDPILQSRIASQEYCEHFPLLCRLRCRTTQIMEHDCLPKLLWYSLEKQIPLYNLRFEF